MNLKNIDNNGTVQGFLIVKSCEKKLAKNGTHFLDMVLADKEGEVVSKLWDFKGDDNSQPRVNTVILIRGVLQQYNGSTQLRVDRFRQSDEKDGINLNDYVPSVSYSPEELFDKLMTYINSFTDENIKKLTTAVAERNRERLMFWPAAFKLHHAVRGGLLMHTLTVMKLADSVARIYPSVDRDLLVAGALLHDIAKTDELSVSDCGLVEAYSPIGSLLGHLVMGAMSIDELGKELGIDKDVLMLVEHMLISHHGKPDFGAAVRPAFLEAEILSQLDLLDANIYEIESAVMDLQPGEFSNRLWALDDRKFYNHGRKTIATEAEI